MHLKNELRACQKERNILEEPRLLNARAMERDITAFKECLPK